jgi:hypothetical protein
MGKNENEQKNKNTHTYTQNTIQRNSFDLVVENFRYRECVSRFHFSSSSLCQNQLSHGFSYSERRGDYGGSISLHNNNNNNNTNNNNNNGSITRLAHDQDPVALHQALQSAVEDGQNPVIDENVGYMSDLPMLKSEY